MNTIPDKFIPRDYKQCAISVLDNISDPDISFDEKGISKYHYDFESFASKEEFQPGKRDIVFDTWIKKIKEEGKNSKYDCIVGLSGGADSSYLAYLAKAHNLRPLIVHFDYGWNTDLAITNIQNITQKLGFELYTYVIDWEIIRDLQRAYFLASVVDLDVPADHTIFGAIFQLARRKKIKYILSGANFQTEYIMPRSWNYLKTDLVNMRNIHKRFGQIPFKGVPTNGIVDQISYRLQGYQTVPLLYYTEYNKAKIIDLLKSELGWRDYGDKHFENVFTRFYQGYILPKKFGIDKRKSHLSNLIFSNQMTKEEANSILSTPPYPISAQNDDKAYVAKKLGFDNFDDVLSLSNKQHATYGTDEKVRKRIYSVSRLVLPSRLAMLLKGKLIVAR